MNKTPKLIKDCKVGDTLYYAIYEDGSTKDFIIPVSIQEIKKGGCFLQDIYVCKAISFCETIYEFNHETSDIHDSLIVDSDYAYDKDKNGRFFTTYDAAVEWLMIEIKYDIIKKLKRLENLEKNNGVKTDIFQTKTVECKKDYTKYKKVTIYDCNSLENPNDIDKILDGKKIKVYKKLIETDFHGNQRGYVGKEIFVKEFDCKEDAINYIFEHDKSRWHGGLYSWYEGETYFIKED